MRISLSWNHCHRSATYNDRKVKIEYVSSEHLTPDNVDEQLGHVNGVVICPGFGSRGIEGKFVAAKYTREHNIPTFGICLGMQCMAIEFARNVLGYADANSIEMDEKTKHNVIDIMEEQKAITNMGGTMRLGAYECVLKKTLKYTKLINKNTFRSVIATVTNSTTTIASNSKRPA